MDQTNKFSNRLKIIASYLSTGTFFADIGTDHAYLPCYVCLKDKNSQAIAGEINKGPYNSACETVKSYELTDQIEIRRGNGLSVLENDQVNELVIAGMGGSLIANILDSGRQYLKTVNRIICQPNIGEANVRKWFYNNGYVITHETLVKENGHIYEIIVADKQDVNLSKINDIEQNVFFGPKLLEDKSLLFHEKWNSQLKKVRKIKNQVEHAKEINHEKIAQLKQEIAWIEEVLKI